jgi:hypothetical protein
MPGIIDFSYNWNKKLDCSHAFTTIRLRNDNKYKIGAEFYINLKYERRNINKGTAHIIDIKHFKINQLNSYITFLDTGYNVSECRKLLETMYKNYTPPINWETQELSLILLVKNKKSNN